MSREEMELALKTKVNSLISKLEANTIQEKELKAKIIDIHQQRIREENSVLEMHAKLGQLEKTLYEKEVENGKLKSRLSKDEIECKRDLQYWIKEESLTEKEKLKNKGLREDYGDVMIASNNLKSTASDLTYEIHHIEKELANEDKLQEVEAKRVAHLSKEINELSKKLFFLMQKESELKLKDTHQKKQLSELSEKYTVSDHTSIALDIECQRLETVLDGLTERLKQMSVEEKRVESMISSEEHKNNRISVSFKLETTQLHKAQRIKSTDK